MPETCPVLSGESPSRKLPCEVESANTTPVVDGDDCVATHQSMEYLPASLKVMIPVKAS
jgi:hypothetical protein